MEYQEKIATDEDMEAINKLTLRPLKQEEVFTFSFRACDDSVTKNNRKWSVEWQEAAVDKFIGKPIQLNHSNDITEKVGVIYSAKQDGNAVSASAFIPLITETDRENRAKIESGMYKHVSINGDGSITKDGDVDVIGAGENVDLYEVSFVAIPGNRSGCEVTEAAEDAGKTEMLEFARQSYEALQGDFVRHAGFLMGTSIKRATYEKIAGLLDPFTLKEITADMKGAYEQAQTEETPTLDESTSALDQQIQQLRLRKGIA